MSDPSTTGWSPSHWTPREGVPAWPTPDPAGPSARPLEGHVQVMLIERGFAGWAKVRCTNGREAWVDEGRLVALAPPAALAGSGSGGAPRPRPHPVPPALAPASDATARRRGARPLVILLVALAVLVIVIVVVVVVLARSPASGGPRGAGAAPGAGAILTLG
ncbi:MAG: hypothetical protein JWN46_1529 [Acidimicrobiales bacterium]|nr:hypothetical protein [Acidimicrobiales bacterium]